MIFGHGVRSLVSMRCDAFGPCDVDESIIVRTMRLLRDRANGGQLFLGAKEAFVASRNVVIDLDPKYATLVRAPNNLNRIAAFQSVRADANVVGPVLLACRSEEHTSELQSLTNLVC